MKKTLSNMAEIITKTLAVAIALGIIVISVCWFLGLDRKAIADTIGEAFLKTFNKDKLEEVDHQEEGEVVKTEKYLNAATVNEITKDVRKMISQEYNYEEVGQHIKYRKIFGKKVPFTTDEVLFQFSATIYAGVDLAEADYYVDNENKVITVSLPKATIISHEVDEESFEYYEEKNSIFINSSMDEYVEEIGKIKEKKENKIVEEGALFEAAEREAENVLRDLLQVNDETKEYSLEFKWR